MLVAAFALQIASVVASFYCAVVYILGYVLWSKGDRRYHTVSLMFTGMGLALLSPRIPELAQGSNFFTTACIVFFLIGSVLCQSVMAFRRRRTDRKVAAVPEDLAEHRMTREPDRRAA